MSHTAVFRLASIVMLAFGWVLLLAPNKLMAMYEVVLLNRTGLYNTSLYGAALIGLGVLNWRTSGLDLALVRPVALGNLVATGLGFASALYWQVTDPQKPTGWINVAILLVLSVLFGILLLKRSDR